MQPQDITVVAGGESTPLIPDHQLLRLIARGSYGEVWLARNTLGAFRAIKIVFERTFRDRRPFERELAGVQRFEPVSRLHDGLMDVLQVGRNERAGYFYCVMELADDAARGQVIQPETYAPHTLARGVAKQKRLPLESCVQVGITLASALEFLHEHGLIHRDVKPSNIVFINGTPKLADIGLVAEMSEARSYVGTEGFIPPEGPGTVQSDIYSLGKVLYEISTGKDRYDYPELPTLLDETTHDTELIGLNRVILRACRSDPRQRYQSAGEMLRDLRALQDGRTVVSRPWEHPRLRLVARLLGSLALLAVALILLGRLRHPGRSHGAADAVGSIPAPEGLVGWWRGEQNANDSSSSGNHGEVLAGTTYGEGLAGSAFEFDGTNSGVIIPASRSLAVESFTIEAWLFPRDISTPRPILEYAAPSGHTYVHLWYGMSAAPRGAFGAPGAVYGALRDPEALSDPEEGTLQVGTVRGLVSSNHWNHVGLTFNASTRTALLFVNGVMAGSNVFRVAIHPRTFLPINLGYRPDGSSELLAGARHLGLLDEVSIYNRPLAPAEIRLIYNAGAAAKKRPSVPSLTSDVVSCWRGEGNARDSFGHNHGELIGGVSFAPGKMGQGFLFNGSNSYVRIPHDRSLELSNELTVEFWYKDTGCPPGHHFYGLIANRAPYPDGANFGVNLYLGNPMQLQVYLQDPMYPSYQISSSPAPRAGVFHHVAVSYTQVTLELVEMKTYVDGQLVHTSDSPGNLARTINRAPVIIGSSKPDEELFVGLIDEPAIYRRALSVSQILAIYEAGTAGERLLTNAVNNASPFEPGTRAEK